MLLLLKSGKLSGNNLALVSLLEKHSKAFKKFFEYFLTFVVEVMWPVNFTFNCKLDTTTLQGSRDRCQNCLQLLRNFLCISNILSCQTQARECNLLFSFTEILEETTTARSLTRNTTMCELTRIVVQTKLGPYLPVPVRSQPVSRYFWERGRAGVTAGVYMPMYHSATCKFEWYESTFWDLCESMKTNTCSYNVPQYHVVYRMPRQ